MPLRGEAERKTYAIQAKIAGGVWVVHHAILGENCVQKTYEPAGREDAIAFAEPRLLNELDHPHITPLREAQFDPDRYGHVTIIMRVYEGGSIYDAMEAGYRFSVGDVITLVQHVADALAYLHVSRRYVHRDIKPKNILLNRDRKIGYLADFGSAAAMEAGSESVAVVRTTALYQAPEAAPSGHVGPAADIYALGLISFEMLNGPFPYDRLDPTDVDRRLHRGLPALPAHMLAPAAFAPHVPGTLRRLVRSMIKSDPGRRPTAGEVLRALRGLKCVDWRYDVGDGIDGTWSGRWPPRKRADDQVEFRLTSTVLRGGVNRGRRRLIADYRTRASGGWRTVGVPAQTVDAQDAEAVSAFFRTVEAHVARRWPA